jgi:hypothetical protein
VTDEATHKAAATEAPKKASEASEKPSTATTSMGRGARKVRKSRTVKARGAKVIQLGRAAEGSSANYPRHGVRAALRIARGILDQNAGKECSDREAAAFVGVKHSGPFSVELNSGIKYGFLKRPRPGFVEPTDLVKKVLRPQNPDDEIEGLREAVLIAPDISDVYKHYRGENLPDALYFDNALADTFHIPGAKVAEFKEVLLDTLMAAQLVTKHGEKLRVLDVSSGSGPFADAAKVRPPTSGTPSAQPGKTCFVMMPFAPPVGGYYASVYEPAIRKAGLIPVRADADIFGTGKIVDQIASGIEAAEVLVAELTGRNPNVFYELGLAHGKNKPVVLVSATESDVPFDLQHIRVIYYDREDPFWGQKLIEKLAENITFVMSNPGEATFQKIARTV